MAVNNSLVAKGNQRLGITAYLTADAVKNQINNVVGGKEGQKFIASIVSAVNTNPALQECTNQSILSGALLGQSLKLSPSPQLGQYYLVPFKDKEKGQVAQFQMGYKGYIQLAIRSGQYKKLNVLAIKKGELEYFDPLNEDIKISLMVDDWDAREDAETIGYYAMFELTNGFRKALYWSKKQMEAHALKYSPGYRRDKEKKTAYTFWSKNFDGMAYKTMLRQLLSKWGVMSIDMQQAFESDMGSINEDGSVNYVENDDVIDMPVEESKKAEESSDQLPGQTSIEDFMPQPEEANDPQAALFG